MNSYLTSERLSTAAIDRFVDDHLPRCDCPSPVQRNRLQVRTALAQWLPAIGAAGIAFVDIEPDAVACELDRFDAYLRDRRGSGSAVAASSASLKRLTSACPRCFSARSR